MKNKPIKAGLLTYHFSDNFGALLQAYALRKWLLERGVDADFINYEPSYVEAGGSFQSPFRKGSFRSNLKVAYLYASKLRTKLFGNNSQRQMFSKFRTNVLGVDSERIIEHSGVGDAAKKFDILIAGSDQIWNPSGHQGLDPVYFLDFPVSKDTRRISYAASFGRNSLDAGFHSRAKSLLASLDAISVREQSGAVIVESVSGRNATCVPDPTFLHGNYSDLLNTSDFKGSGHVFCYALRTGSGIRDVADFLSAKMGNRIISPYNEHRRWRQIGETVYPGPADWVKMISSSGCVVTNSFHATVFAVLLHKPFWVVGLPGTKSGLNERAKNLLAQLGLESRFIEHAETGSLSSRYGESIDWNSVDARRLAMKKAGEDFLSSQLQMINA